MATATEFINALKPKYQELAGQQNYVLAISPNTLNLYKRELYMKQVSGLSKGEMQYACAEIGLIQSVYGLHVVLHPDYDIPDIIKLDEMPIPLPFD